jgi:nitrate/nitrite transport system ATP-binding protein
MAFLSIERVSKDFPLQEGTTGWTGRQESFCVFREVDLRLARGEFLTLIGHSGCGKSTLLNIIAGFEQASTGGVILDGREVTAPGLDRMVVFQSFALMPWLTAFDNVRLAVQAAHPRWDKTQVREETQRYLDLMGLKGEARLAETVEVNIPRPRSRETMIDAPEYTRLRNHILHFLLRGSHAFAARELSPA